MDFKEICYIVKDAIEDKKGEKIRILDLKGISSLADGFVIASGNNVNQLRAIADNVEEKLAKRNIYIHHKEGYQTGEWILLDFGGVIVHLFNKEKRDFYDLDRIWSDAKEIV
ncbi:MAG: ribosome silencing factor [Clostridia bacterium]|jgi:ribosome-associated protein|nr:ribosome silencing factor [Clostridia bacterium]